MMAIRYFPLTHYSFVLQYCRIKKDIVRSDGQPLTVNKNTMKRAPQPEKFHGLQQGMKSQLQE